MDPQMKQAVIRHAQNDMANLPEAKQNSPPAATQPGRTIGQDHVIVILRLGFHELTNVLAAFPDTNIRPMEEPGVFGNENAPQRLIEVDHEDHLKGIHRRSMAKDHDQDLAR